MAYYMGQATESLSNKPHSHVRFAKHAIEGTLIGLLPSADDPRQKYRRAELRLREALFGDAMYSQGAVTGEEQRAKVAALLRKMHEAVDELTQHETDLAEELLETTKRKTTRR